MCDAEHGVGLCRQGLSGRSLCHLHGLHGQRCLCRRVQHPAPFRGSRRGQGRQPALQRLDGGQRGQPAASALHGRCHDQPLPVFPAFFRAGTVELHHAAGRQQRHDVAHAQFNRLLDGPVHLLGRAQALRQTQLDARRRLGRQLGQQRHPGGFRAGQPGTPAPARLAVEDFQLVTHRAAQHPQQMVGRRFVQGQGGQTGQRLREGMFPGKKQRG